MFKFNTLRIQITHYSEQLFTTTYKEQVFRKETNFECFGYFEKMVEKL